MMKNVLQFLKENYQFLSVFLSILITLLVSLFRKKAVFQGGVIGLIIRNLPEIISNVEASMTEPKCGTAKKARVMDIALYMYKQITGVDVTYDSVIARQLDEAIENILATPQKKGE